jgi:hypothetical protein
VSEQTTSFTKQIASCSPGLELLLEEHVKDKDEVPDGAAPSDKSEVTHSTFTLNTEEDLNRLLAGDRVALV